ncbi:hypothetical protein [Desertibaculum subflavum]|uniref:hypothetical protein n=1 Tax=Desertibaculum subflavum TaxID=2268458 RepID=UPI000E667773
MTEHARAMRRLVTRFFPPPIRTPDALGGFLVGQANYVTQRVTYEFCRNTLGYFGQHMFADLRFQAQERLCRWEGFAAVLADGLVLAEGLLRPAAPAPLSALRAGLITLYADGLAAQPEPVHRADGFADLVDSFAHRLDRVAEIEPRPVRDIAHTGARRVYDVLPIYSGNEAADREGIDRAMLFCLISVTDQLSRRLDAAAVGAALVAAHADKVA